MVARCCRVSANLLIYATFTPFFTLYEEIDAIYLKFFMPNILEKNPNQSKFQSYSHVTSFLYQTLNMKKPAKFLLTNHHARAFRPSLAVIL
jgi:hypothetical protein